MSQVVKYTFTDEDGDTLKLWLGSAGDECAYVETAPGLPVALEAGSLEQLAEAAVSLAAELRKPPPIQVGDVVDYRSETLPGNTWVVVDTESDRSLTLHGFRPGMAGFARYYARADEKMEVVGNVFQITQQAEEAEDVD